MAAQQKTEKVAVLGGGPAAIAAAFELTDPSLQGRYEVTVLQPGWRLGGKCASGRNLEPQYGKRIEEHGLHVWFGFYENALRLMRRAYDDAKRPEGHPLRTFDDAFKPCNTTVLYDKQGRDWVALPMTAPENDRVPGQEEQLPSFWDIAKWVCEWAIREFHKIPSAPGQPPGAGIAGPSTGRQGELEGLVEDEAPISRSGERLLGHALDLADRSQATGTMRLPREQPPTVRPLTGAFLGAGIAGAEEPIFVALLCGFRDWLWTMFHGLFEKDAHWRAFFTMFDTFASAAAGVVHDGVLDEGWEAINEYDLCEWLSKHGAKTITVGATPADRAPMLRAIYDVAFGYPEGKIENANVAAGTAMNDLLRLAFSYAGSIMFKMQAGMGDSVFTPFYEVLKARGVKFSFFSWVTALHLSQDHARVQSIDYVEQVDLAGEGYEPTLTVNGLDCWPSGPLWSRIPQGEKLSRRDPDFEGQADPLERGAKGAKRLELGRDFDHVVLGIPVGALEPMCAEIAEHHPPFRQMLAAAVTVRTQAFQLWLGRTPTQLGWAHSSNSVAGCYVEPLDTWCDMTHLLDREEWPANSGVNGLAYFCGVLDHRQETPAQALARVKDNAEMFLVNDIEPLWPTAVQRGGKGIDWGFLATPGRGGMMGPARLAAQYFRANTRGSELYVLTPKGTVKHRLRARESGVCNLYLAGDWTRNGVDGGCVEAAIASGVQAALGVQGSTRQLVGEGDTWVSSRRPGKLAMPPPSASIDPGDPGPPGPRPGTGGAGRRRDDAEPDAGRPPAPTKEKPMTPLDDYVEYGGRATAPPPFLSTEGTFRGYLVQGDKQKIADLVQRVYNVPAAGKVVYRPMFGKWLLLQTGAFKKVSSQAPGFENWGYVDEAQISIWIPVEAGRVQDGEFIGERIGMAVPYILVNNPMSYAGGREIYGYPKTLGIFDPASGVGDPLTVEAFGGQFSPGSEAGWHRLFELRRTGTPPAGVAAVGDEWHPLADVRDKLAPSWEGLAEGLPELSLLESILNTLAGKQNIQVFLKQFRDVKDAGKACYRHIVEAPIEFLKTKVRPSLDQWQLVVNHLDSHPVDDELGLTTQATNLSFDGQMDFVAAPGRVVAP